MYSSEHGPWLVVYKVEYFVKRSLSSSLVLPNTRLPLNPTLRVLSYNTIMTVLIIISSSTSVLFRINFILLHS